MAGKFFSSISSLIYKIPGRFSKKLVMIGNILFRDWRIDLPGYDWSGLEKFRKYGSLEELPDLDDLDARSRDVIRRFMSLVFMSSVFDKRRFFYNCSGLLERLPRKKRAELEHKRREFLRKYGLRLSPGMSQEDAACCFSHGLSLLPERVTGYVADKLFVDAGAYIGDSALSFLPYRPKKILSFEPSSPMFAVLRENLARIAELREKCEIFQMALGEESGELHFCDDLFSACHEDAGSPSVVEQTTVDDFVSRCETPVGLIKADIEGMGLKMIRGAKATILRDRPVLTLAVYHCPDEAFGIREELKSWDLGYKCRYEFLEPESTGELTLIAYPSELD